MCPYVCVAPSTRGSLLYAVHFAFFSTRTTKKGDAGKEIVFILTLHSSHSIQGTARVRGKIRNTQGNQSEIIGSEGARDGEDPEGSPVVRWPVVCRHGTCPWLFPVGQVVILAEPLFGVDD